MSFTAVATGITQGINIGSSIVDEVGSWFGGGKSCGSSDIQQRDKIESLIKKHLSASDKRQLTSMAESNISPTAREMANFYVGGVNKWGGDCYHKNVSSGDQRFLDQLPQKIKQRAQEQQADQMSQQRNQQYSGGSGSGGGGNQQYSGGSGSGGGGTQQAGISGNMPMILLVLAGGYFILNN